ncbi:hypothetical protein [Burkholderia sp. S-53]|uniref:hypothetical protein n=1 Tax=Burkholderia sp. S-53 TaxID=2906514 RepID=UPI0021D314E4|nr:hypothetical protein [Burkholderia sp. S-53]UXU89091.1 hypothetical protein LXM88_11710 [Burkholderia sp. S-53]
MELDLACTGMGIAPDLGYKFAMTGGKQRTADEGECESGQIVERRRGYRLTPEKDDDASTRLYWRSHRKGLGSQR